MPGSDLPDKLFFKIGEVAQIVGVRPHVLRYWESEFAALRPLKTRGAHRVYRRKDVELAVFVKRLLHEEGLTIAGAKRRLRESRARPAGQGESTVAQEVDARVELLTVRAQLAGLLERLDRLQDGARGPQASSEVRATVTASVPNSVPVPAVRRPQV